MKISKMTSVLLAIPMPKPVGRHKDEPLSAKIMYPLIVQLTADNGLESFGLVVTGPNDRYVKSLKAIVDSLGEIMIGQDVHRWAAAWQKLCDATRHMANSGYGMLAVAAIDTALWSMRAKEHEIPLGYLLGGFRERVPVYASHRLFRNWTIDELQKDSALLVEQGFRAMKMRMGDEPFGVEIERLKAVREAVGKNVDIMIDVNSTWTVSETIKIGRKIEKYDVYWLEDPLATDDPDQLAQVANALDIPIVAGESHSGKYEFRELIDKHSADILQVDMQAVGGITGWMKVAAMAEAWNIPVASHLFHEFSLHLVAAVPNGLVVEYMPWWDVIYKVPPRVKDGYMEIPNLPGIGLELDPDVLKKYELK